MGEMHIIPAYLSHGARPACLYKLIVVSDLIIPSYITLQNREHLSRNKELGFFFPVAADTKMHL